MPPPQDGDGLVLYNTDAPEGQSVTGDLVSFFKMFGYLAQGVLHGILRVLLIPENGHGGALHGGVIFLIQSQKLHPVRLADQRG